MRFDAAQHMRLDQRMKLAPRMIQSMEILQMPLLQLEERIEQELEANVLLERSEAPTDENAPPAPAASAENGDVERPMEIGAEQSASDFERLESFESANPEYVENEYAAPFRERDDQHGTYSHSRLDGERDAKMDAMASAPARAPSLVEQLREQWALCDVDPPVRALGELLISFIDDDGYLRTPLATIADRAPAQLRPVSAASLERALSAVQLLLDPPGVAARDARECLLLQLDALEADRGGGAGRGEQGGASADEEITWADVRRIVEDHLDDASQNRLPRIAEKLGLTIDQVTSALKLLRRLSLAPGRRLVSDAPSALVPDAIVEYDTEADRYIAYLNESRLPNLRINREYALMASDRAAPAETRQFIRKNLANASWLIDAVEQRKRTLLRVLRVVIDAQRDYFDYGPQSLRPLPMTQVADQLGVHVATVSRAVADKFIQTPRGVVPLRGFFSGGTHTESGEEVSWDAIKAALKEVIDAEDKTSPLSDDALAEELKKRGIEIARRTVAKYRGQLGVPSTRLRKVFTAG